MLLGSAVAAAILFLGVRELEAQARDTASLRSEVLADTLAARLSSLPEDTERVAYLEQALSDPGSAAILLDPRGEVLTRSGPAAGDAPLPGPEQVAGALRWGEARARFHSVGVAIASPDGALADPPPERSQRLVVLTRVASTRGREQALLTSLLSFAVLLLGAAGFVAWALARDVHADVLYLRGLIVSMAKESTVGTRPIPVRTIDQVGQLTASFNTLLERFRAAERAYRQDLNEASAYDRDRTEFLAALSHELRTPLNAILGFADVLLSGVDGPLSADSRENLTIVRTSGEHLRSLIDDILALSALESGQFRLSREELNVTSVAQDVVTEARVTADQKEIYLELAELSEGPMTAYADRRRLRQILQNLISNAVKFTSKGGVVVTITREEGHIVITISDTGPGIERDALDAIWSEFSQAGADLVKRQGTGLGLSITRRLVQMHGGTVRVESEVDRGSTFIFTIPIHPGNRSSIDSVVPEVSEPIIREV